MWKWLNCYLSGRHEFGVWCEPGAIFLRCAHCGKRSAGWSVDAPRTARPRGSDQGAGARVVGSPKVVPFGRVALR